MLAPYLEEMATKLEGKASFYKVDVDSEQALSQAQNITAMPTIKVFNNGVEVAMIR
jgi:thioredoxin 1